MIEGILSGTQRAGTASSIAHFSQPPFRGVGYMQLNSNRVLQAITCCLVLLITSHQCAAASSQPAVSTIFAIVVQRIDTRSASLDQELTLRTISDVVVDGVIV